MIAKIWCSGDSAERRIVNPPPPKARLIKTAAFSLPDLLVVLAIVVLLAAVSVPPLLARHEQTRQKQCVSNIKEISRAVLLYADENKGTLPLLDPSPPTGVWW